jgi:hypothetical protein
MKQNSSTSDKIKIIFVIIFLGVLLLVFGILMGLLLRQNGFRLSMLVPQPQATSNFLPTSTIPTVVIPTPDCGAATLVIGTETFQIQTITPAADGSLTVPPDTSGIAYWVEGTDPNYVFVLSPMPENLAAMSTLTVGSTAKVTWPDCSFTTYSLSSPQQGSLNDLVLPDQSLEGITVFFQTDASGAGFMFKGELTEEQISTINTPDSNEVQAEIGLLETSTSSDGTSIKIGLSIQNYGASPIVLSASDVSLTQQDGTPLDLGSSTPRLPEEIKPGETKTIEFIFSRPSSLTATLKILTVEYEVEGY